MRGERKTNRKNRRILIIWTIAAVCSGMAATPTEAQPEASFQGLGFLPGGNSSYANAVSADGTVVVGNGNSSYGGQAFRWT